MSGPNAIKGGQWTNNFLFTPIAGEDDPPREIPHDKLLGEMKKTTVQPRDRKKKQKIVPKSETIKNISVCKAPLSGKQVTDKYLHHQFVVAETDKGYWSFEKNSKGIAAQRGDTLDSVRGQYGGRPRPGAVEEMYSSDVRGKKSVKDVVDWIDKGSELNKKYHVLDDNCKAFTKRMYDEFGEPI